MRKQWMSQVVKMPKEGGFCSALKTGRRLREERRRQGRTRDRVEYAGKPVIERIERAVLGLATTRPRRDSPKGWSPGCGDRDNAWRA
jgi:hypothetical protein